MKTTLRTIPILTLLLFVPAVWAVNPDAARTLLEQKDLTFDNDTLVQKAAEHDFEAVELFLEAGINPDGADQYGNTAMIIASMQGYDDILELLDIVQRENEGKQRGLFDKKTKAHSTS